jgi:succinate dehydrogenase / fumarate reductase, membrane anchor subunit
MKLESRSINDWKTSQKHGVKEWIAERLTSVLLIPLTLWAVWAGFTLAGQGFDSALSFVSQPVNALILVGIAFISLWHQYMGLKVIIDDYIAKPATRKSLILLNFLSSALIFIAVAAAVYLIYQGV